ncbi:MAG TPA: class I SAM-dependent methyltransferase [Gemmatimonadales bacterium]
MRDPKEVGGELPNTYSTRWFELFLDPIDRDQTAREVAFVARHLPLPHYRRVLDVCCGSGRHALPLAARGYEVTGIDNNRDTVEAARSRAGGTARFLEHDMRRLDLIDGEFDGCLILWQSFGHFDQDANTGVLRQVRQKLRPGGRLILDVYNRDAVTQLPKRRTFEQGTITVRETRSWTGSRLTVELDYGGSGGDRFSWHVFTPDELTSLTHDMGLELLQSCTWFDETRPPSAEHARMQLVLEKVARD